MNMTGEQRIAALRPRVWEALNDPGSCAPAFPVARASTRWRTIAFRNGGGKSRSNRGTLQGQSSPSPSSTHRTATPLFWKVTAALPAP